MSRSLRDISVFYTFKDADRENEIIITDNTF